MEARAIRTAVGFALASGAAIWAHHEVERSRRRRRHRKTTVADTPDVVDLPEPEGITYDNRPPCPLPDLEENPEGDEEGCIPLSQIEPEQGRIPFAIGEAEPIWPLITSHTRNYQVSYKDVSGNWHGRWGREFGASRSSSGGEPRVHAGVDLFAEAGDVVRAMELGEVIAILPFYHGAWAIYVVTPTGLVINYGEIERGSWREFGIEVGSVVEAGQPLGRVGEMREASMLHIQMYRGDTTVDEIRKGELRWIGDHPPSKLLDPTEQLVVASWRAQGALA